MDEVERAKAMLAGGDLWAVSGAHFNTNVWFIYCASARERSNPNGTQFYLGPFDTTEDARTYVALGFPNAVVCPPPEQL